MARILLANAPYLLKERYGKLAPIGATLPCLGLLMLGAILRQSGHRVRILDASALGLSYKETIEEIKKLKPGDKLLYVSTNEHLKHLTGKTWIVVTSYSVKHRVPLSCRHNAEFIDIFIYKNTKKI